MYLTPGIFGASDSPAQVRKYQQAQQLRTSLSASQATLDQLARELGESAGPSRAGSGGKQLQGLPPASYPVERQLAGSGPAIARGPSGPVCSPSGCHAEGGALGLPPGGAELEPVWLEALQQPRAGALAGEGGPSRAGALSARGGSGEAAGAEGGSAARPGLGAADNSSSVEKWRAAAQGVATAGGVVVKLKSDRPFQMAGDIERRQRQQESMKVRRGNNCRGHHGGAAGASWWRTRFFHDSTVGSVADGCFQGGAELY